MRYNGIINKYKELLDLPSYTKPITLNEGNTPLIEVPRLVEELGGNFNLFVKYEGLNPTGSFKDRGMTTAISEAFGRETNSVICASTGNTAASAAAYAARAGIKAFVLIPEGNVALGKIAGAIAYKAEIIQIQGSFDDALEMVIEISSNHPIALVNSINPYRIEGQQSGAFEICEQLGTAPDICCLPVGNAGNITSYWKGFKKFDSVKQTGLPQMLGVQAAGSAPLVIGEIVNNPETIATAIKIGKPARGEEALLAASESNGKIIAASDEEILEMQRTLASEGIWVEPASAAGLAGLKKEYLAGNLDLKDKNVVAICTGHGMKDPDILSKDFDLSATIPTSIDELEKHII